MNEYSGVTLKKSLTKKMEDMRKEHGFSSVAEYVRFLVITDIKRGNQK